MPPEGIAELAHQQQRTVLELGGNRGRPAMAHDVTDRLLAVVQPDPIADHAHEAGIADRLAFYPILGKVSFAGHGRPF